MELKLDFSSLEKFARGCKENGWIFVTPDFEYDYSEKKLVPSKGSGAKCIIPVYGVEEPKKYDNYDVIDQVTEKWEHIGTSFIKGIPGWLKTKTFNLYKKGDAYVVTNHYGAQLINAFIYPNKKEFEKDFGKIEWKEYKFPLLS